MIIFDLACKDGHQFEGWFRSAQDYDSQLERGMVVCPHCGSPEVHRVPSAVRLAKPSFSPIPASARPAAIGDRAAMLALLQGVVANCEDVGKDFASEARKIHYMEVPERPIFGEATVADCEALLEEGIKVLRLPRMKKDDLH